MLDEGLILAITLGDVIPYLLALVVLVGIIAAIVFAKWGSYWIQSYMSGADISMLSLITMSLLSIDHRKIVTAKVMGCQSGVSIDRRSGMSTSRLLAHDLTGGNVMNVVKAIIAAQRAGIELDFDRAAAIDLAGRDVLAAVQTSISPQVIHCPRREAGTLSAIARNGVELRVSARVTVRTNIEQLIGGATEETIIARVGQGIITAIGSAESHMDVLELPSQISKGAMARGLDSNTAFSIVSIDIAYIDIGQNIGARLQSEQAEADTRMAQSAAEGRRANAVATEQEMRARTTEQTAALMLAESEIPRAMAEVFYAGRMRPSATPIVKLWGSGPVKKAY